MPSVEDFVYSSQDEEDLSKAQDEIEGTIVDKKDPVIVVVSDLINEEYESGQVTEIFETGMKCESKRLYPKSDGHYIEWVDEIPPKVMDQSHGYGSEWSEYALLLRTNLEQGEQRIQSVVIQSPLLRSKLNTMFNDYPGFFLSDDKPSIDAPFKALVHNWKDFIEACEDKTETGQHMQLLKSVLEPELQTIFSTIQGFYSHGMIQFDQLWIAFKPGSYIFSELNGIERIHKVCRTEIRKGMDQTSKYFLLHCYYIDWDGSVYGNALDIDGIEIYEGSKKFTDLGVYPLDVHPSKASVIKRLVERGRKFSSYTGVHYLAYEGLAADASLSSFALLEEVYEHTCFRKDSN
jgi:uncharacterized protein DUF7025